MENASKALIIAGEVLISLLIISGLVVLFNNLQDLQEINQSKELTQQVAEFNNQFNAYERNVYGSELLSVANKIDDYNKRESDIKGFQKIELEVRIKNNIDNVFFVKGTYNSHDLMKKVEEIENKVKEIGSKSIKSTTNSKISRKVSQLAGMHTTDIEALGFKKEDYINDLTEYNTYKSLITEIKAKVFKYDAFEYDKNTSRITKMKYTL